MEKVPGIAPTGAVVVVPGAPLELGGRRGVWVRQAIRPRGAMGCSSGEHEEHAHPPGANTHRTTNKKGVKARKPPRKRASITASVGKLARRGSSRCLRVAVAEPDIPWPANSMPA